MRPLALLASLSLVLIAPTGLAVGPPDCDMPQTTEEIVYCVSRVIDAPAPATTHAAVGIVAAGCYVEEITAHASGKGMEYSWDLSAGAESDSGTEAGAPSPLIRDNSGYDLQEGQSIGGSASIWNTLVAFDQAHDSRQWTCVGGDLVEDILALAGDLQACVGETSVRAAAGDCPVQTTLVGQATRLATDCAAGAPSSPCRAVHDCTDAGSGGACDQVRMLLTGCANGEDPTCRQVFDAVDQCVEDLGSRELLQTGAWAFAPSSTRAVLGPCALPGALADAAATTVEGCLAERDVVGLAVCGQAVECPDAVTCDLAALQS